MADERLAQARAEAERRYPDPPRQEHHAWARVIQVHSRGAFRAAVDWADANPKPHTITHDDMGAAYAAFMEAEGHPVRRFIVALKAAGIEAVDDAAD